MKKKNHYQKRKRKRKSRLENVVNNAKFSDTKIIGYQTT